MAEEGTIPGPGVGRPFSYRSIFLYTVGIFTSLLIRPFTSSILPYPRRTFPPGATLDRTIEHYHYIALGFIGYRTPLGAGIAIFAPKRSIGGETGR